MADVPRVFVLESGTVVTVPDGAGSGQVWQGFTLVNAADLVLGDGVSVGCGYSQSDIVEIDPT